MNLHLVLNKRKENDLKKEHKIVYILVWLQNGRNNKASNKHACVSHKLQIKCNNSSSREIGQAHLCVTHTIYLLIFFISFFFGERNMYALIEANKHTRSKVAKRFAIICASIWGVCMV